MDVAEIKSRFGIIGNDAELNHTIETAAAVAPINLSVLVIGESGSGKEVFPQIIHAFSPRKHKPYVAVNCGAIPEGTIDSELFGHEKGAFTGALSERRGYFEEADGGTIFLDEIGELPLATQAKLLRILEKGEYMRVGSSVVKKTDVRIVAATNVELEKAISNGRFREDLFYRLNGIMLRVPPLRKRVNDIPALFHKFTSDFADKNHIPQVRTSPDAIQVLKEYSWPGNVRQLKNVAEQATVLASERVISGAEMLRFIPDIQDSKTSGLAVVDGSNSSSGFNSDRDLLYKVLFDMRRDVTDLKQLVLSMLSNGGSISPDNLQILERLYPNSHNSPDVVRDHQPASIPPDSIDYDQHHNSQHLQQVRIRRQMVDAESIKTVADDATDAPIIEEKSLSISDNEKELIRKALERNKGSRRKAAKELQISERTLYRKIKDYELDE